ncbi:MAG: HAD family phosphatase [Tannerellaceae bacterium]|jgi:HAD superfamily hydrolase (TIGR01509 family)|nr:HAD family phosphatase [Tannerellaceae bacterium]
MKSIKTALVDFDGVIADTEPIYDLFWDEAGERYQTGIRNFAHVIKGTTLPNIIDTYFADRSDGFKEMILRESAEYESRMPIPLMPGAMAFLSLLKENGVKTGLVTSSDHAKMERAFALHPLLRSLFDTLVTADRITRGKPDPMCYLLAASDLGVPPGDCLVFEDSFAGIQSGTAAGMRVIGLSTTNAEESIRDKVYRVIPGFEGLTFEQYRQW